jgi:hypothetical protein
VTAALTCHVKAVVLAPWLHDGKICAENYGGDEGVAAKITESVESRARYEETGEVEFVPVISGSDPRGLAVHHRS